MVHGFHKLFLIQLEVMHSSTYVMFYYIPGAAQLVRMFTKRHVASKLRKIWKI